VFIYLIMLRDCMSSSAFVYQLLCNFLRSCEKVVDAIHAQLRKVSLLYDCGFLQGNILAM
jgi:hypothetical protein